MLLRRFRYFIAVADQRSFQRAARQLRVAQPSLSKQIQNLEREVGLALFERLPRGVRLTPAGEALLVDARNTVDNAAKAIASARRAQLTPEARLHLSHGRLGIYATPLANLLCAFRLSNPTTEVQIHRLNEEGQRAALREGLVDVAATFVSDLPIPGFAFHRLVDCSLTGVILPSTHPLANKPQISLPELRPLVFLHIPRQSNSVVYHLVKTALARRGLVPDHRVSRPCDAQTANLHIAAGRSWMLANEAMAATYGDGCDAIVYRPFAGPPIEFWLALLWCADHVSPLIQKMIEATGVPSSSGKVGSSRTS
jgi:DNA-binding transcriptional LysR family regulator